MAEPVPFPLFPDASAPMTVTFDWFTDILVAESGAEQRISVRGDPVQRVSFGLQAMTAPELAALQGWVESAPELRFYVPFWFNTVEVLNDIGVGDTSVAVSPQGRDFPQGSKILLVDVTGRYEIATVNVVGPIEGMDADLIALTTPTTQAWPIGTMAVPMFVGILTQPLTFDLQAISAGQVTVEFTGEVPVSGLQLPQTGEGTRPTVTQIVIVVNTFGEGATADVPHRSFFRAMCYDATGARVYHVPVVWEITGPVGISVVPSLDPMLARVNFPASADPGFLYASIDGVSDSIQLNTNSVI